MDNFNCDNLTLADTGIPGGGVVDSIGTGVKDLAATIRNKAKAKKAQGISDAGGYNTLTPFQKSLIAVPDYIKNAPGYTPAPASANIPDDGSAELTAGDKMKKYLPWILGILLIGGVIYGISHQAK